MTDIALARARFADLALPPAAAVPSVDESTMLAVDRIATDEINLSLLQMMESAGRELATLARRAFGGNVVGRRITVLAGTGNNAGGGLVAARRLAEWGTLVSVIFARPILRLRPGPCSQIESLQAAGVGLAVAGFDRSLAEIQDEAWNAELLIDALIGYRLAGAPDGDYAPLIELANAAPAPVLSLDLPSGVNATSGATPGVAVRADATMAVGLPKAGTGRGTGAELAGVKYLADIGIPASVYRRLGIEAGGIFTRDTLVLLDGR